MRLVQLSLRIKDGRRVKYRTLYGALDVKNPRNYLCKCHGYVIELRNIFSRVEEASFDEEKLKFLIPILMAGTKRVSVPKELHHLLFISAVTKSLAQFDFNIFLKEMWPLFETRFFKDHPRLGETRELLSKSAVDLGFGSLEGIEGMLPLETRVTPGVKFGKEIKMEANSSSVTFGEEVKGKCAIL